MSSNASRYQVAWSGLCVRAARLGIRGLDAYSEAEARARVRALWEAGRSLPPARPAGA